LRVGKIGVGSYSSDGLLVIFWLFSGAFLGVYRDENGCFPAINPAGRTEFPQGTTKHDQASAASPAGHRIGAARPL
jgi:hypothetical protein